MLQKIVNGIAILSGVVSISVVGTVGYVYVRKDAIIEDVKGKIMESVMPGGLGGAIGGGALDLPASQGPGLADPAPLSLPVPSSPF